MKKTPLIIAALLAALAGSVHAQATASTDPIVQMREQQRAANATFSQKRAALRAERDAQVAAAADAAGKEATAKGQDPLVARRDATTRARSATKADFDAKMKVITQERDAARAAARAAAPKTGASAAAPKKS
jgi:hypothetical protein